MLMKLAALLALACIGVAATGCNTIEGAGKDIKAAGGAIEKSAEKTKPY
jgi:entericidin B